MATQQPAAPHNGSDHNPSPACLLLQCAEVCYRATLATDPASIVRAQYIMDDILAAARAGGFAQGDILATLLARNEVTARVRQMAEAATAAAGESALRGIVAKYQTR
ncbi:hypothetical protein [Rugamonas apoptosis]|uniref:Uncharacterized protein n=1 Tax=Rugamonas apoptosis TaxID=2758570 RepID=A0A7W2F8A5_9BURK|nr:hypothetical protein [Rugamonas apoptosis]MBA5686968.1 hypothetical protein [Rugamonas apoptosis]